MLLTAEQLPALAPTHVVLEPGQSLLVVHPRQSPPLQVVPLAAQVASALHVWVHAPATAPAQLRDPPHALASMQVSSLQVP
jgi:hypothetical protein